MSKTIHDKNCDCVVCMNDYLKTEIDKLEKRLRACQGKLYSERKANAALSEYKSAKDALVDVAGIKQAVARKCIELSDETKIREEFGL